MAADEKNPSIDLQKQQFLKRQPTTVNTAIWPKRLNFVLKNACFFFLVGDAKLLGVLIVELGEQDGENSPGGCGGLVALVVD